MDDAVFTADVVGLLESGCGLIIGTTGADGSPRAARAWGIDILDPAAGRLRVLIGSSDMATVENLVERRHIAVTGTDIGSLQSAQVKGTVTSVEPVTAAGRERSARYCDDFFAAVALVDDMPRHLMERLVPLDLVECIVQAAEVFDQTPGPGAGAPMAPNLS